MFSYRREKEEEGEDPQEEEGKRLGKKRKKKEPPKPWGKTERALVAFLFMGMAVTAGALALSARAWKLAGLPRLGPPNISFEKTYILDSKTENPEDVQQVINEFRIATNRLTGVYGFNVIRVHEQVSYGVNEDEVFEAEEILSPVTFAAEFLLEKDAQAFARELGMRNTELASGKTTPGDVAKFYEKLWNGRVVDFESQDEFFLKLRREGDFIHYGSAGIMAGDSPFVLVIMSKGAIENEKAEAIPELQGLIFDFEQ